MHNNSNLPFLIAEISANHCGEIKRAKKLIACAKKYGADAVKLQTYTADSMTIKSDKKYFKIKDGLWKGRYLWDLYDQGHTPILWHKELFLYAKKLGIIIFSSPFDENAVDLLEKLHCPIYKLASFEMTDLPLVKKIAQTKKPMIISTGMANLDEIQDTFSTAKKNGCNDITLLYCVSNYPSKKTDFNLNNIKILKNKFKCRIGFSDHSNDIEIAKAAIAAGAEVIEKHIALENQNDGLDIEFSLKEIKIFRKEIDSVYALLGKDYFLRLKSEKKMRGHRRSIFVINDIKKGEKFTSKNIRRIRPGNGVEPKYYNKILSQVSPVNIKRGQPFSKGLLQKLKIK